MSCWIYLILTQSPIGMLWKSKNKDWFTYLNWIWSSVSDCWVLIYNIIVRVLAIKSVTVLIANLTAISDSKICLQVLCIHFKAFDLSFFHRFACFYYSFMFLIFLFKESLKRGSNFSFCDDEHTQIIFQALGQKTQLQHIRPKNWPTYVHITAMQECVSVIWTSLILLYRFGFRLKVQSLDTSKMVTRLKWSKKYKNNHLATFTKVWVKYFIELHLFWVHLKLKDTWKIEF